MEHTKAAGARGATCCDSRKRRDRAADGYKETRPALPGGGGSQTGLAPSIPGSRGRSRVPGGGFSNFRTFRFVSALPHLSNSPSQIHNHQLIREQVSGPTIPHARIHLLSMQSGRPAASGANNPSVADAGLPGALSAGPILALPPPRSASRNVGPTYRRVSSPQSRRPPIPIPGDGSRARTRWGRPWATGGGRPDCRGRELIPNARLKSRRLTHGSPDRSRLRGRRPRGTRTGRARCLLGGARRRGRRARCRLTGGRCTETGLGHSLSARFTWPWFCDFSPGSRWSWRGSGGSCVTST